MDMDILSSNLSSPPGLWLWTWEPSILSGLALWTAAYLWLAGPLRRRRGWGPPLSRVRQAAFHAGTAVAFLALVSPLDHLADEYLFTAHMVQHLLLLLAAPPLWLLGLPNGWLDEFIRPGPVQKALRGVTHPVSAFVIFNAVLGVWHIPVFYDAALANERLHVVEHLSFLAAAFIGWWPVLGCLPKSAPRATYPAQLGYLFAMMFPSMGLAAAITFSGVPFYPFYAAAPRLWGISVMDDQQLAGLIMWVPGNMVYFAAFMVVLNRWFKEHEIRAKTEV